MEIEKYSGPDYCVLEALDADRIEVRDNHGEIIGIYPSWKKAQQVQKNWERFALRKYLQKRG